jgi:hypothetical protein
MLSFSLRQRSLFFICALTTISCCSDSFAAERPFAGFVSGTPYNYGADSSLDASGTATHLGECVTSFSMYGPAGFYFTYLLPTFPDTSFYHRRPARLLSADGSALYGTIQYESYDPVSLTAEATLTIDVGRGRFEGAAGAISVLIVFTDPSLNEFDCLMIGTLDY